MKTNFKTGIPNEVNTEFYVKTFTKNIYTPSISDLSINLTLRKNYTIYKLLCIIRCIIKSIELSYCANNPIQEISFG